MIVGKRKRGLYIEGERDEGLKFSNLGFWTSKEGRRSKKWSKGYMESGGNCQLQ